MSIEGKHLHQFTEWLEKELVLKGKISMDEILTSGAEKMNWTIDTAKKYLGKALMLKSGQIKLNLDESKGMKFLEYRKDFHYTGDRRANEEYHGTETQKEKEAPAETEDSQENIYGMKHEAEKYDSDKDSEERKEPQWGKYSPGDLEKEE